MMSSSDLCGRARHNTDVDTFNNRSIIIIFITIFIVTWPHLCSMRNTTFIKIQKGLFLLGFFFDLSRKAT